MHKWIVPLLRTAQTICKSRLSLLGISILDLSPLFSRHPDFLWFNGHSGDGSLPSRTTTTTVHQCSCMLRQTDEIRGANYCNSMYSTESEAEWDSTNIVCVAIRVVRAFCAACAQSLFAHVIYLYLFTMFYQHVTFGFAVYKSWERCWEPRECSRTFSLRILSKILSRKPFFSETARCRALQ